jgi:hypothetical protein
MTMPSPDHGQNLPEAWDVHVGWEKFCRYFDVEPHRRVDLVGKEDDEQLPLVAFQLAGEHNYDEFDVASQLASERGSTSTTGSGSRPGPATDGPVGIKDA